MPSHGSITKAGKVRNQTPKIPARPRKNLFPRARNRKEYLKFLKELAEAEAGGGGRRRRRGRWMGGKG